MSQSPETVVAELLRELQGTNTKMGEVKSLLIQLEKIATSQQKKTLMLIKAIAYLNTGCFEQAKKLLEKLCFRERSEARLYIVLSQLNAVASCKAAIDELLEEALLFKDRGVEQIIKEFILSPEQRPFAAFLKIKELSKNNEGLSTALKSFENYVQMRKQLDATITNDLKKHFEDYHLLKSQAIAVLHYNLTNDDKLIFQINLKRLNISGLEILFATSGSKLEPHILNSMLKVGEAEYQNDIEEVKSKLNNCLLHGCKLVNRTTIEAFVGEFVRCLNPTIIKNIYQPKYVRSLKTFIFLASASDHPEAPISAVVIKLCESMRIEVSEKRLKSLKRDLGFGLRRGVVMYSSRCRCSEISGPCD